MRRIGSVLAIMAVAAFALAPAAAVAAPTPVAGRSWEVVTGHYVNWPGHLGALGFVAVDDGSVRQTGVGYYFPSSAAYSPDARTVYTAGETYPEGGGQVGSRFGAFDAASGESLWQIDERSIGFSVLAVSPDGSAVMLARGRVDVATQTFERFEACTGDASSPSAVAFAPDGGTVWFLCTGTRFNPVSELRAFDAVTLDPATTIPLPDHYASALSLTPDGSMAVVTGTVDAMPNVAGVPAVTRVDLATAAITDLRFDHPDYWPGLAMAPDGAFVYVAAEASSDFAGELYAIDVASMTVTTSAPFPNAGNLAVTPDGAGVYSVAGAPEGALVTAHDAATLAVLAESTLEGDGGFRQLAVTPDQAPVARLSASVPNSPVTFDASGSTVQFGSIAEYAWDFGDGATVVTSNPVVEHEYAQPGVYAASVRLTSSGGTSTEGVYTGQQLLRNGDSSAVATVTVTVPQPGELPELPPTGLDGVWLVAVAAGLLGAGLAVLGVTRRRRTYLRSVLKQMKGI